MTVVVTVETMDKWIKCHNRLKDQCYQRFQIHGGVDEPNGFQATFWKIDKPLVEIITHNKEIYEAIGRYPRLMSVLLDS